MSFADGAVYEGQWQQNLKHGKGTFTFASGTVQICRFEADKVVGQGARWSADRAEIQELQDGKATGRMLSPREAAEIAARLGLPVPP